jgi:hypothetical protein
VRKSTLFLEIEKDGKIKKNEKKTVIAKLIATTVFGNTYILIT